MGKYYFDGYVKNSIAHPDGMTLDQAQKFRLPFGKYKTEYIEDVFKKDEDYIDWLYDTLKETDNLKLAIELVCYTKHD